MDKNRKFTVTWNELESLVEGLVTELLHKYGLLESWDSSSEDGSEEGEYIEELYHLIDLYEKGEICTNDEDEDYGILYNIRHFRRGDNESDPEDLYNLLKKVEAETDPDVVAKRKDKKQKQIDFYQELKRLMDMYEEGEIYTNDEDEDYGISLDIRHYRRGEIDFDIDDLYNLLKRLAGEADPDVVAKTKAEKQKQQEIYQDFIRLMNLYDNGEIYTDDEGEDYGISLDIRHYRRGEIDFNINDLYNLLKRLHLECLIQLWEEGDIYTDDEETENTVNDWVERYKNGDENFDSDQLYNWLND